ncbi:type II toxin-antitoxin system RelE/ParE family toxin [Aliivibrio fischeri]|uniref:type II toxin-antitoxin system RelE/ParE family toxin n=1 Tax=Aliivibrio fischeri TaxID=668 RepID=UPI001354AF3A|nr:type II toxin-antitoxin system RelE/ParE family toxin [Aliivibrio fischeri]
MYKLSNKSIEDFEHIYEYTYLNFGENKADTYTNDIEKCLLLLSHSPQIGRSLDNIKKGIYRHDHENHSIFYRIKSNFIFIIRILHQQMNPVLHL